MALEIIWEPYGVYRRFYGAVTRHDLVRSVAEVHTSPQFDTLYYSINDLSSVTEIAINASAVEGVATQALGAALSNNRLIMVFVAHSEKLLSLAKIFSNPMYQSFPAQYFSTLEEARAFVSTYLPKT
ncbi:MAG: hypothetical protein IPG34_12460 [Rhodocyclaceae bacterium]|nr:hypothetical protein [Rhodocyclaceae bacterium]